MQTDTDLSGRKPGAYIPVHFSTVGTMLTLTRESGGASGLRLHRRG